MRAIIIGVGSALVFVAILFRIAMFVTVAQTGGPAGFAAGATVNRLAALQREKNKWSRWQVIDERFLTYGKITTFKSTRTGDCYISIDSTGVFQVSAKDCE